MPLSVSLRWQALVLLALIAFAGCGASEDPQADIQEGTADPAAIEQTSGVKTVDASKLPALGDPLPNLDGGRVTNLAPPKGWEPLSRDNKHLARFAINKNNPNDLPRILITAEDASSFTEDVTSENVAAFAESLAAENKKFVESPKPIILGDNAYARYVTDALKGTRGVERQILETVFDGRRYAIILEVYSGTLLNDDPRATNNRDLGYAVAAGVEYVRPGGAQSPLSKEEPTDEKEGEPKTE